MYVTYIVYFQQSWGSLAQCINMASEKGRELVLLVDRYVVGGSSLGLGCF